MENVKTCLPGEKEFMLLFCLSLCSFPFYICLSACGFALIAVAVKKQMMYMRVHSNETVKRSYFCAIHFCFLLKETRY